MNENNLMQTPYVTIRIDQTYNMVVAKWIGFLTLDEVITGCRFMTQLFKEHGITIHMSEHRALAVLSDEVQEYLVRQWFPEIAQIGVRKVGAVAADDVFAEATVWKVNQEASSGGLIIEMFANEVECVQWLIDKKD